MWAIRIAIHIHGVSWYHQTTHWKKVRMLSRAERRDRKGKEREA